MQDNQKSNLIQAIIKKKLIFPGGWLVFPFVTVGIVAASLLLRTEPSCGCKSFALIYIQAINRMQQASHIENGYFMDSLKKVEQQMEINNLANNQFYQFSLSTTKNAVYHYAFLKETNQNKRDKNSFVGAVFAVPHKKQDSSTKKESEFTIVSIVCQINKSGQNLPLKPIIQNNVPVCASGTSPVS
jgi:Type IV pilin-like G and H, putative